MPTAKPITVFVCGPDLSGEVLTGLTVCNGAVVWEGGAEAAPLPVEPIHSIRHVPIAGCDRLIILATDAGLYVTTVDALIAPSSE